MSFHDDELARYLEMPNLSPASIQRAEQRVRELKQQDSSTIWESDVRVTQRISDRTDQIIEASQEVFRQVADIEGRLLTHRITAEDAQKGIAQAKQQLRDMSKVAVALRNQKTHQDGIFADPLAEADRIFELYPALQSSRQSLFD